MGWQELAGRQHGVLLRSQLRSAGQTDRQIDRLIAAGHLAPIGSRGVLQVVAAPATALRASWTAVLATRAPLSHFSAAEIWKLPIAGDGRIHVTSPNRRSTRMPSGVRVHRVLLPDGAMSQQNGLPLVERSRTLLDCIGLLPSRPAESAFDYGMRGRIITPALVRKRLVEEPNRRGNAMLRRLLDSALGGDSVAERILHRILRDAGIGGWAPNARIDLGFAVITVDVCFRLERLIVEVDGWAFHTENQQFQSDRTRQNALNEAGWEVRRFTWAHLTRNPAYVVATIRAALGSGVVQ